MVLLAVCLGWSAIGAASASADRSGGLLLTLAARSCPAYTDITANLARNNIMESLRDLGPDTPYEWGALVDPETEERVQPKCVALPNWTFTLGDNYVTRAVTGPWGSLSIVRNPFDTRVTTAAHTELLDWQGLPTGRLIAGATTIRLNSQQEALAARRALWVQGGTPSDPVLNEQFPGPQYGFGALRCAVDNVNGDNVEYVAYPAGVTHVFCFAYYVLPPPTSGTIVIRKQVEAPSGTDETFGFDGNISYNPGGRFDLAVKNGRPAEERFFRGATGAANKPWTVRELGAPDWRLKSLACTSRDRTSTITTSEGEASIELGAGDLVTCTYTDSYEPPTEGLALRKVSLGGTGRFDFDVQAAGGGESHRASATTTLEGIAADADPSPLKLPAGGYRVGETVPQSHAGHWRLKSVECEGDQLPTSQPIEVTVPRRGVRACTFTNKFIPRGSISISKITKGAVGTTGFLVTQQRQDAQQFHLTATTTEAGEPARANGEDTDNLPLGHYAILDFPPDPHGGEWTLEYVECNGTAVPFAQGRIEIKLTSAHPHADCAFTNRFDPTPAPEPEKPQPPSPEASLAITKTASTNTAVVGDVISYRLDVVNHGTDAAKEVMVIDEPQENAKLVSAKPSQGACASSLPLSCNLGTLEPGQSESVQVKLKALFPGPLVNFGVLGTITPEARPGNSSARTTVRVKAAHAQRSIHGLG